MKIIVLSVLFAVLLVGAVDAFAANTAPTVNAGPDTSIDEGDTFSFTGSFTDPDADTWSATVDYGDGSGSQALTLNADKTFDLFHVYATDGTFTVTVTINDGSDDGIDTVFVTVNNVLPIIDVGPDTSIDEGDTFSFTGSFTDPGDDTWSATVDYGDGMGVETIDLNPVITFVLSHVYDQDSTLINGGPFTVTVTINDSAGDSIETVLVTVDNVLPSITSIPDVTIDQGDTFTTSGSFTDPGSDAWTAGVTWGELDFEDVTLNPDKTFALSHVFSTVGVFTVTLTISDGPSSESSEEFLVTVNNVAPTLSLGAGTTIDEGDAFSTTGSFTDPGDDPWTITADYGDGTGTFNVGYEDDQTFQLDHVYSTDGTFTITVTVDDGTTTVTETLSVTVNNVSPTVDAGLDATIDEGDVFTSMGVFTDPGSDAFTVTVDYGDFTPSETILHNPDGTFDLDHVYSTAGIFTVTVTVDDGVDSSSDTAIVTVNNIAPVVTVTDQSVDENRDFTASGSFADPGDNSWTATVDYGDGSGTQPLTLNPDKSFTLSHSYATNGAYTVTVTVNDDDASGVTSFTVGVFVSATGPGSGLISPPDVTSTLNEAATFFTTNQDIWGPITGGSGTSSWELFNPQTWDESDGDSSFVTLAKKKLGGGISAGTNGHLKLTASASQLNGKIDVNYPGTMAIQYLDANTFLAGESIPIGGSWNLNTGTAKINAEKTMGDLRLDLDLGVNAFVDSKVCLLVGCFDPFVIPDVSFDMHPGSTKLFSFTQAGGLDIPPALTGFVGFTGNFNPIMVQPPTTSVSATTGRIVAETTTTFSDMEIDIDKVATRLGIAPPLGASLTKDGVGLTYDFFDADANVDFKAHQKLTFDTGVLVKLDFDTPVDGVTGSVLDVATNGAGKVTSATYRAGNQINVIFPQGETNPITVTPTIFLDSSKTKLNHFTELITVSDVEMESMSSSLNVPGFTVVPAIPIYDPIPHLSGWECHGILCVNGHFHHGPHWHKIGETPAVKFNGVSFSIGPAWESGPQGVETKKDVIANKAFALGGFNTIPLASFELDPEVPPTAVIGGPYVVPEGSVIVVDGSGSFDIDIPVQTLTHTWDLDNDASFETSGVTVDFAFGIDGPATHPISIQVCDDYNCDIDSGMVDVFNVDPTVDAGEDESIDEGSLFTRIINFEDPGADTWDVEIDYGDSHTETLSLSDRIFELSHTYADDGVYTVSITITDDDAGVGSDSFTIIVNNVNPAVDAGADDSVDEGTLYSYISSFADSGFDCVGCGTAEDFTATIDWGDNTGIEPLTVNETPGSPGILTQGTASGEHTYADNGVYTVTVIVTDDNGGSHADTLDITVYNVDPTVEAGNDQEVVIHDLVELNPASFTDPGFDCDVCGTYEDITSIVNWGEGNDEPLTVNETPGSPGILTQGTASGNHIYRLPGDYTVTVSVDDDDTGTHSDTFVTTVLGAQDLKNRVISFLTPYNDQKDIEKAIDAINDSLDAELWTSNIYLDEKYGHKVFNEEKKAVKELQKVLKDGEKKGIDPTLKQTTEDSIDLLVNADRVLAITIMLDSESIAADDPKKQDKVDKENEKAVEEFAKADQKRDEGDFDKAIDHYKKAWEHAQQAIKHATK